MQYTNIEGNLDEIQNFINALDDYCDSLDKHTKSIQRKNDEVLTNWKSNQSEQADREIRAICSKLNSISSRLKAGNQIIRNSIKVLRENT